MAQTEATKKYLDEALGEIRWKRARDAVRSELAAHIEDQAEAFQNEGMPAEEAEARAIKEMGDPVAVGARLDASFRPRSLKATLIPLGVVLLFSIICRLTLYGGRMSAGDWGAFIAALAIGGGCFAALFQLSLDRFVRWSPYALAAALAVMLLSRAAVYFFGRSPWDYRLAFLNYAVCVFPALLAGLAYRMRGRGLLGLAVCGAAVSVAAVTLLSLPAAANALELAAASFAVLVIAVSRGMFGKRRGLQYAVLFGGTALGAILPFAGNQHRLARLAAIINPSASPFEYGWYALNVKEALASSRLVGASPDTAQLASVNFSLASGATPDTLNNYMLTVAVHSFGWLFAALIVLALFAFIGTGVLRALKLKSQCGRLLALSILISVAVQAAGYVLCNLGIIIGVPFPLPFLSSGNTALVLNLAAAGLLASLIRTDGLYSDIEPKAVKRLRLRLEWVS